MSDSVRPCRQEPARLLCPGDSPGKNTGVGRPFPPPGDLPEPRIEPVPLMSPELAGRFFTSRATWEAHVYVHVYFYCKCICIYMFYFSGEA